MSRLGHTTKRYYLETRGMKVSGGQFVRSGTVLTRQGHRWQPGLHVIGRTSLTAGCDGHIYFTKKRNSYKKVITLINIKPVDHKE